MTETIKKALTSKYTPPNKNITFKAVFSFNQLKWSGNSRKTNFRLAAHSLLNSFNNTSLSIEDLEAKIKQLSLPSLNDYVKSSLNIPQSSGLTTAQNQLSSMLSQSQNIQNLLLTNVSTNFLQTSMSNFLSSTYSLQNTLSNLLQSSSKTATTQKIYASSDIDTIQVL